MTSWSGSILAGIKTQINRWWAIAIGAGVALSPIHNQGLTKLLTNSKGEVLFFLPAFGYLLIIMGAGLFLLNHWAEVRKTGLGDKHIYYPLLIIVGAIALSGSAYTGWEDRIAPALTGLVLFALYLAARVLGKDVFLPLAVGAVAASLGVIATATVNPTTVSGGLLFEHNYDIVVGYVLLGTALFARRWQWLLAGLALVAMFLAGSAEGLFVVAVSGAVVLARRDWGRKLMWATAPVLITALLWFSLGWGQQLWGYTVRIAQFDTVVWQGIPENSADFTSETWAPNVETDVVSWRLVVVKHALENIKPLGDGFNLTAFRTGTVHNVPLILVQQMGYPGAAAALAWLWVTFWCLRKTQWKYAWVLILALSVFDHFIWTQMAPVWWLLAGVSTASTVKSDLVFKPASDE